MKTFEEWFEKECAELEDMSNGWCSFNAAKCDMGKAWTACAEQYESKVKELEGDKVILNKRIDELEKELELRTVWTNHHKRVSEIDAEKKYEAEKKVRVAVEALEYGKRTLEWYREIFQGPEHEFEHYWGVELPHEIDEALAKIRGTTNFSS